MTLRSLLIPAALLLATCSSLAGAATPVTIGVVTDGPMTELDRARAMFFGEITALTEGEFDVRFPESKQRDGQWSIDKIKAALNRLQRDPVVDIVLALGYVSSQVAATSIKLSKPTFAPLVLDANLLGLPRTGNTSGVRNLNYLTEEVRFTEELLRFREIVAFTRLSVVVDATIFESVPELAKSGVEWALKEGVELNYVVNSDADEDLAAGVPADTQAVMVAALPRLSREGRELFIRKLIERKLPSYSLIGTTPVEQGLLAAEAPDSDWRRLARRNALNIQAVLLGERAGDQSVAFRSKRELTINMATARALGISPRFDVLSEAVLLNDDEIGDGIEWSLAKVAEQAVRANLDIRASLAGIDAGAEQVRETRSALFPQVNASIDLTRLDDSTDVVRNGLAAKRSTTAALGASQILYSESTRAGVDIQRAQQRAREAAHRQTELDIVQEATVGFLNILTAQTQVEIRKRELTLTRTNLTLARDRVRLGSANAADVFRWESRIATTRQDLLGAESQLRQAVDNLNRLLHKPIGERFATVPATLDDPTLLISREDLLDLINNERSLNLLSKFFVQQGLANAPELLQLDAQIASAERQLSSARRSYWSPEVTLNGQASEILDEQRNGGTSMDGDSDWSVGINATLPVFQGGAKRARVNRSKHEIRQLRLQRDAFRQRTEQSVRANIHATRASFPSIELAQEAAEASRKNFELVQDSYSQGTMSVIDLLDAQDAALDAEQAAVNAVYNFLIDLMNLQRSTAEFDFFLDDARRDAAVDAIKQYIATGGKIDE